MTEHDLKVLDTIDSPEYMSGELSDDGRKTTPDKNGGLIQMRL
jgi:hypothetical protein